MANNELLKDGFVAVKASLDISTENGCRQDDLPRGISTKELLQNYLRKDGSLRTLEEYRALMKNRRQKWGKRSEKRFNTVKDWFEKKDRKSREAMKLSEAGITQLSFSTLADLVMRAETAARVLQESGNEQ